MLDVCRRPDIRFSAVVLTAPATSELFHWLARRSDRLLGWNEFVFRNIS